MTRFKLGAVREFAINEAHPFEFDGEEIVVVRDGESLYAVEDRCSHAEVALSDGDVSGVIATSRPESGVDIYLGTGGAPEGVLTAAAMRCLNGEIFARLVVSKPEHEARCRAMGITDFKKVYTSSDLARGENIIFAATGVTEGTLMKGVRFFGDGVRTASMVMQTNPHRVRFIDSLHVLSNHDNVKLRF